jgi:hypothetical protein
MGQGTVRFLAVSSGTLGSPSHAELSIRPARPPTYRDHNRAGTVKVAGLARETLRRLRSACRTGSIPACQVVTPSDRQSHRVCVRPASCQTRILALPAKPGAKCDPASRGLCCSWPSPAARDSRNKPPLRDRAWRRTTARPHAVRWAWRPGTARPRRPEPHRRIWWPRTAACHLARPCRSQPSKPGSPSWCVSTIGARSAAGGSSIHAPQRRDAGPALVDWVVGGWRGLSISGRAVGLVAIGWCRSTYRTSSAWIARPVR